MTDPAGIEDFEQPIRDLEKRIQELESFQEKAGVDVSDEIRQLRKKCEQRKVEIFRNLTPWQRVQLARHPERPLTCDYLVNTFEDFVVLHGDKCFGNDPAIVAGPARIGPHKIMLVAQKKGKTTKERMACNFGSPHPEGYRKAIEKMRLAEKFGLPVVTLINTPGAYPGIGAEERGQSLIIARNIMEMAALRTPILSVVIGEGGSGGALAICLADHLAILENAYLSVISPEGCAAILWHDASRAPLAAERLRMTPKELEKLGIVDGIVSEPLGGAHRDPLLMGTFLRDYIEKRITELRKMPMQELIEKRYDKYRKIGVFLEEEESRISPPSPQNETA